MTAVASCSNKSKGNVIVTWTASTSTFTAGYTVLRDAGTGSSTVVGTATAPTTSFTDTTVSGSTTYTYSVEATYAGWTSAAAAAAPVTTARRC